MARTLTKKQRGFVNDKADGKPGVIAALNHYDTKDYMTANAIAVENLQKPLIQEELKKLGFDSNNAKQVVAHILNDEEAEHRDRLKAADMVFSVDGTYAATKTQALNLNVEAKIEDKSGLEAIRKEYEEKVKQQLLFSLIQQYSFIIKYSLHG